VKYLDKKDNNLNHKVDIRPEGGIQHEASHSISKLVRVST